MNDDEAVADLVALYAPLYEERFERLGKTEATLMSVARVFEFWCSVTAHNIADGLYKKNETAKITALAHLTAYHDAVCHVRKALDHTHGQEVLFDLESLR